MSEVKQVLCMKWGTMYGSEYVNNLYGMVARNICSPFTLTCLTDNSEGIRKEVHCLPLPRLDFEVPPGAPGKWPKQALWREDVYGLNGVYLFLDLDSVIVGAIDDYFDYGSPDDVIVARNWVKPWLRGAQTSVFRFMVGSHSYMYDDLAKNPSLCVRYQFEQNYVTNHIKGGVKFWPSQWTKHFRKHSLGIWPMRYIRSPRLPKGCRIITFPGSPKPSDAIAGRWNDKSLSRKPIDHIWWAFSQSTLREKYKQLKRFVLPCDWIKKTWNDNGM
jgi:hypothetical protein